MFPISYQNGMPISIDPEPLGDMVVAGVNFTISVLDEVLRPKVLVFELNFTFSAGVIAC